MPCQVQHHLFCWLCEGIVCFSFESFLLSIHSESGHSFPQPWFCKHDSTSMILQPWFCKHDSTSMVLQTCFYKHGSTNIVSLKFQPINYLNIFLKALWKFPNFFWIIDSMSYSLYISYSEPVKKRNGSLWTSRLNNWPGKLLYMVQGMSWPVL